MIVSDALRLAFLHIPKCAGSTVRRDLVAHDSLGDMFHGFWTPPHGVRIDMLHITLAQLEAHFPDVLDKVRAYESYAVIREPARRLFSSLAYYMGSVQNQRIQADDPERIERTLREVADKLAVANGSLESRFVYFTRQSEYVRLRGKRLVRHLYPLEELSRLAQDVQKRHGVAIDVRERVNPMAVDDGPLVRAMRRVAAPVLPRTVRLGLRAALLPSAARTGEALFRQVSATDLFQDLMERYYGEDVFLYRSLTSGKA
jgi:hypothetical protein